MNITQNSCRIDCHADKQESRPVVPVMAADEKLTNTQQKIPCQKANDQYASLLLMFKL